MRLIDADALKKSIKNMPNDYYGDLCIGDAIKEIDNAPMIDAVLVVRCRECIYRQKAKVNRKGFLICPASGMEITDDDYCSYGAKMEDKP